MLAITGSTMPFFVTGVALNLFAVWLWSETRPDRAIGAAADAPVTAH